MLKDGTVSSLKAAMANNAAAIEVRGLLEDAQALDIVRYTETVTLTNAVTDNLSILIPAGASILSVKSRLDTLVAGDGTGDNGLVKVGIGTVADPDAYGLTPTLLKNAKSSVIPAATALGAALQIAVRAANTSGVAVTEKFVAGATVTVEVVYRNPVVLPDAA